MMTPHFILVGAMKCGTTTLAAQLAAQPGIFVTDPKEPNYFSDDEIFARGYGWYASLFEPASPDDVLGEASTHYTKRPDYPDTVPRMRDALETVRLVYMIRNPLERLVSHYMHAWSEGEITCELSKAIQEHRSLTDYGRYGWQIEPFAETYGVDALLLTSLERLRIEPDAELARIAAHIGHTGRVGWVPDLEPQNVSAERVRKLPFHEIVVDHPLATALRRRLVPKWIRTQIRSARKMSNRPQIAERDLPALQGCFTEDHALLAKIFPGDPSLTLAYPFVA